MVFNGYDMSNPAGTDISWAYWITAPGPLPSEASMVYSDTVAVYQNDPIDPKNSYSFTENFSSTLRTSAIHASMTGITVTSDVDLYLLDTDSWEILAKSQEGPGGDELLDYLPSDGEYRLGVEPHDYTLLVHGFNVPDEPITPTLQLWTDELNVWLDYPAAKCLRQRDRGRRDSQHYADVRQDRLPVGRSAQRAGHRRSERPAGRPEPRWSISSVWMAT